MELSLEDIVLWDLWGSEEQRHWRQRGGLSQP